MLRLRSSTWLWAMIPEKDPLVCNCRRLRESLLNCSDAGYPPTIYYPPGEAASLFIVREVVKDIDVQ